MLQIEGLHDPPRAKTAPTAASNKTGQSASSKTEQSTISKAGQPTAEQTSVITQLTSGVRNPNRVNVFVNGRYALSLDVNQIVDSQIKVGKVLSEDELQELHSASEFGKLYQRALEWALTRPRSVKETRDYLKNRQFKRLQTNRKRQKEKLKPLPELQTATLELVLQRLIKRGYVDDQKFAEFYVENRFVKKGISSKRLRLELSKKGLNQSVIDEILSDNSRDDQTELQKMLRKKRARYDDQKLVAYLVRQGFNYQDVVEAVANFGKESQS